MGTYHAPSISQHAVERYVKRHAPHMSMSDAELAIRNAWRSALKLKEKSIGHNGGDMWYVSDLNVRAVCKKDPNLTVITILPENGIGETEQGEELCDDEPFPAVLEAAMAQSASRKGQKTSRVENASLYRQIDRLLINQTRGAERCRHAAAVLEVAADQVEGSDQELADLLRGEAMVMNVAWRDSNHSGNGVNGTESNDDGDGSAQASA